jgi:hypothetical protein
MLRLSGFCVILSSLGRHAAVVTAALISRLLPQHGCADSNRDGHAPSAVDACDALSPRAGELHLSATDNLSSAAHLRNHCPLPATPEYGHRSPLDVPRRVRSATHPSRPTRLDQTLAVPASRQLDTCVLVCWLGFPLWCIRVAPVSHVLLEHECKRLPVARSSLRTPSPRWALFVWEVPSPLTLRGCHYVPVGATGKPAESARYLYWSKGTHAVRGSVRSAASAP